MSSFAIFCVAMIATIISVNYMSPHNSISGQATSIAGNVTISVGMILSITTEDDSSISLGCMPGGVVYTNETNGGSDGLCEGFVPDGIVVRNDGSFDANVSVGLSNYGEAHGGSFLNASSNNSWVAFKISNTTTNGNYSGGCYGTFQAEWVNVTSSNLIPSCDRLKFGTDNSFTFDMAFFIPENISHGSNNLSISFIASHIS